jgi:hypothetical protein
VAGDGTPESTGAGGLAVNARVNGPSGVAFDAVSNLFIAEVSGNRIREVLAKPPYFVDIASGLVLTAAGGKTAAGTVTVAAAISTT